MSALPGAGSESISRSGLVFEDKLGIVVEPGDELARAEVEDELPLGVEPGVGKGLFGQIGESGSLPLGQLAHLGLGLLADRCRAESLRDVEQERDRLGVIDPGEHLDQGPTLGRPVAVPLVHVRSDPVHHVGRAAGRGQGENALIFSAARRGLGLRLLEERSELGLLLHQLFQARRSRQLEEGLQSLLQLLGGLRAQVGSQPGLQDGFAENLSVLRPKQRNLVAENCGWFGRPGLPRRDDQPREQVAFDRSVIAPPADHGQDVEGEPGEFLWDALLEPLGRLRPEGSDGFIRETMTRSGARCRAAESLDRPGQDRLHRVRFLRRERRAKCLGRPLGIEPGDPLGGGLPGLGVAARQGLEQPPGTIRVFLENLLSERAIDL